MRIVEDGEIQFRGPTITQGYWNNPEATAAAFTEDGWYKSGDLGAAGRQGPAPPPRAQEGHVVLPNGFNVFPEDIENALRVAGIRDSVAVETKPGRIEVVVLRARDARGPGRPRATPAIEGAARGPAAPDRAAVKAANASLGPNQRIAGWRLWPEADFPRTHTFKVKRDRVRTWATIDGPLQSSTGLRAGVVGPLPCCGSERRDQLADRRHRRGQAGVSRSGGQRRVREERERRAGAATTNCSSRGY